MSLELSKKGFSNLENGGQITVAQMFDFIKRFIKETYKHDGVKKLTDMPEGSSEEVIINAYALSEVIVSMVKGHEGEILRHDFADELQKTFAEIDSINSEFSKMEKDAQKLIEERVGLKEREAALSQKNAELQVIKKECDKLQESITNLNDSNLEGIAQKRDVLRDELKKREIQKDELEKVVVNLNDCIKKTDSEIVLAEDESKQKEATYKKALERQSELKALISEFEEKKNECEKWIEAFKDENFRMIEFSEKYSALYAQIYTSINSIFNESYIRENLFAAKGNNDFKAMEYPDLSIMETPINNVEDLRAWLHAIENRIKGLLTVYQDQLKSLVECSKNITEEVKNEK